MMDEIEIIPESVRHASGKFKFEIDEDGLSSSDIAAFTIHRSVEWETLGNNFLIRCTVTISRTTEMVIGEEILSRYMVNIQANDRIVTSLAVGDRETQQELLNALAGIDSAFSAQNPKIK